LSILKQHLVGEGAIVSTANSTTQAIPAIYQQPFDLVLSDFRFQGESNTGLDVLAHCTRSVGACLMSGDVEQIRLSTLRTTNRALNTGTSAQNWHFIAKPFELPQISAKLVAILNEQRNKEI
jgi:CheY-like chemotaxis protein